MQKKLPNSDLILAMGISSVIGALFCCGPFGSIFGVIGLLSARKANRLYNEDPENYSGINNVNTGKVLSWIGIVLSIIMLFLFIIYFGFIIALIAGSSDGIEIN